MKNLLDNAEILWYNGTNPTMEELKTLMLTMDKLYQEQETKRRELKIETFKKLKEHPELRENYIMELRYPKIISTELSIRESIND